MSCWVSGIRRVDSETRADAPKFGWDERFGLWKLNPLADWDEKQVWNYIKDHHVPYNPLHDQGYPVDRMHALHHGRARGRGRARRPLGRNRPDRVRHPRVAPPPYRPFLPSSLKIERRVATLARLKRPNTIWRTKNVPETSAPTTLALQLSRARPPTSSCSRNGGFAPLTGFMGSADHDVGLRTTCA